MKHFLSLPRSFMEKKAYPTKNGHQKSLSFSEKNLFNVSPSSHFIALFKIILCYYKLNQNKYKRYMIKYCIPLYPFLWLSRQSQNPQIVWKTGKLDCRFQSLSCKTACVKNSAFVVQKRKQSKELLCASES